MATFKTPAVESSNTIRWIHFSEDSKLDHIRILAAAESSFRHHFLNQKERLKKISALKDLHQITAILNATRGSEKFVFNLSELVLTKQEGSLLKRGHNFAVTNSV
jgi:hypothetical protein